MPVSNQIELRHLKYFKMVAEELHFRKAADRLFITQPGLSRQIQQLEESLGVDLLIRDKRSVALTSAGKYLVEEVAYLQNHLEQMVRTAQLIDKGEDGEVRISFVGSAMHQFIPSLLKKLNDKYPHMHTALDQLGNQEQMEALHRDRVDIGFIRSTQVRPEFELKEIHHDYFSLVVPEDHPLSDDSFKSVFQLKEENFILFSQDYSYDYYELVMSIFKDQGFAPHVLHRSVHPITIFRLVENNMGVAIVPSVFESGFDMRIKFIRLSNIAQRSTLSAIWKKTNRNPALKKFLELLE